MKREKIRLFAGALAVSVLVSGCMGAVCLAEEDTDPVSSAGYGQYGEFRVPDRTEDGDENGETGAADRSGDKETETEEGNRFGGGAGSMTGKLGTDTGANTLAGTVGSILNASEGDNGLQQADTVSGGLNYKITPILDDSSQTMARCCAPEGYTVSDGAEWLTANTGLYTPVKMHILAISEDASVEMGYFSPAAYIDTIQSTLGNQSVLDTQQTYNFNMMMPVLQYMDAGEYCDFVASSLFPEGQVSFLSEKSVTAEEQNEMNRKAQEVYNAQQQGTELLQAVYDQTGNMINASIIHAK